MRADGCAVPVSLFNGAARRQAPLGCAPHTSYINGDAMKTKIWFIVVLSILLAATIARAQFIKAVGLKAGAAISNIRLTDVTPVIIGGQPYYPQYNQDNIVSPSACLFVTFLNEEHFALQADLTYLRKGASYTQKVPVTTSANPDGDGTQYTYTDESQLQYLELALAAQPRQTFGDVALYAHIGPTGSYLLSAANTAPIERLNRFQFGYTLGIGVDLGQLFTSPLLIEARYATDFSSFFESSNAKLWNRSWIFSIGTAL